MARDEGGVLELKKRKLETAHQIAEALIHVHPNKKSGPFTLWIAGVNLGEFLALESARVAARLHRKLVAKVVCEVRRRDQPHWHGVRVNEMPKNLRPPWGVK